jgi:hypothetical protein
MGSLAAFSSYKIFHTTVNKIEVLRSAHKVPDIFVRFLSNLVFLDRFPLKSPTSNFVKICPFGAALIHADRHTNRHEVISRFSLYMCTCLIASCLHTRTYTSPYCESAATGFSIDFPLFCCNKYLANCSDIYFPFEACLVVLFCVLPLLHISSYQFF